MAVDSDQALPGLLTAYTKSPDKNETDHLNKDFRSALRQFAETQRLHFSTGRDSELSAIAIAFPLDEGLSPDSFEGAFRTFKSLLGTNLGCDITLLGWTAIGGRLVGRDVWDRSGALFAKPTTAPNIQQLEQFSDLPEGSTFPMSAIFEVVEGQAANVRICGSPVLLPKVQKNAPGWEASTSTRKSLRAPEVRIEGISAVDVAAVTIREYSVYVAALFENFD
ncbi:hypothetical protein LTR10_017248 [Elasticomyces elasticus]|uniref:Uncharacterized protein n=1 Tax=Exophiala sideris TaxID=1016849 RepID=A0ABR0JHY8_9EURO|nr:hypothetical protein LTR10_017248 [Elasticomyces elasticus]KAK5034192.1 hypothetical protein LTS07_003112 [Exophiala sideris]KAK5042488.1 hypothetical protein LTR13_001335 [Exophiala sideris]KAK5065570.1 hypothetical protein LTR69_003119 [Exophiala sideris]KAK5185972.1 hypothetical protein LTR44_002021 [Eurotiomycetes sp. CCFEE 6388]